MPIRPSSSAASPPARNLLLAALSPKAYRRMLGAMREVEVPFGKVLYQPGGATRYVYFPNDSLVSLLVVLEGKKDGAGLEVGLVGREGMVGFPLALGVPKSPVRALVQGEGSAMRMTSAQLVKELGRNRPLKRQLERCGYVSMVTAMQIAACNKAHRLEARLARWLLMVRDRLSSTEFRLTQHFLAQMLGVRRAGVNEAASALQRRGLIQYRRGRIMLVNPAGLRAASCSCYGVIRQLEDRGA
jgi:CRP-like cAMP-binding protein